jgi:hypothetical protein
MMKLRKSESRLRMHRIALRRGRQHQMAGSNFVFHAYGVHGEGMHKEP